MEFTKAKHLFRSITVAVASRWRKTAVPLLSLLLVGCVGQAEPLPVSIDPMFAAIYSQLEKSGKTSSGKKESEPLVTLSAEGMPLIMFARTLSDMAGISIVVETKLDDREVSVDVVDVPLSDLLGVVSRRVGVQVSRTGDLYFIGDLRPEDKGVLVRKVGRLTAEEIQDAVSVLTSEHGRVSVTADGILSIGDRVEVLSRVHELLEQIAAAQSDSWLVQLHLVKLSRAAEQRLGFDVKPMAKIAATFGTAAGAVDVVAGFDAILRAESKISGLDVVAEPLFVLIDGSTAEASDASEIPIRTAVFDDQGNQTTEQIEFKSVGLKVAVTLREIEAKKARLSLNIEMSSVRGFLDAAPIIDSEKLLTEAFVSSGRIYLLGSLEQRTSSKDASGILTPEIGKGVDKSRVQVWARIIRID